MLKPTNEKIQQKNIIKAVSRAMIDYAPAVCVTKKELQHDLRALRAWRLRDISDWFYVYDAIGSIYGEQYFRKHPDMRKFYSFARTFWRYDSIGAK
jgi:hypothetical protein